MNELYHYGVLGMKWGVRKDKHSGTTNRNYRSTGIAAGVARMKNRKVDSGFDRWKEGAANRDDAIAIGKKRNDAKIQGDKDLYKDLNKQYRQALKKNTTYRKGSVKKAVESDLSSKYLYKANRVKKQLDAGGDKALQKEYNKLMSQHDIHRARSRRAQNAAANRSRRIAAIKRSTKIAVKTAVATAAIGVGLKFVANKTNLNVSINAEEALHYIKQAKTLLSYIG